MQCIAVKKIFFQVITTHCRWQQNGFSLNVPQSTFRAVNLGKNSFIILVPGRLQTFRETKDRKSSQSECWNHFRQDRSCFSKTSANQHFLEICFAHHAESTHIAQPGGATPLYIFVGEHGGIENWVFEIFEENVHVV